MTWDGSAERRRDMIELESKLAQMAASLGRLEENQKRTCDRLTEIEASIHYVEGAWTFARYVFPFLIAVPAAVWAIYEWSREHLK